VGCGTGENALYFSARGHETWAIDFAANALRQARAKAQERGSPVVFREASALALESLGETFDTVTDSGTFHTFLDPHRPVYSQSVRSVLRPGGRFFLLCFSETEPTEWGGPRRVSQEELRRTFSDGWDLRWIHPAHYEVTIPHVEGRAWLAAYRRA
jgi:ubiquinone/menaquinone biosynthesis C-methylase UbiE